ncbi:hypothetical protein DRO97_01680 [Archaeoglobales archaeon]|nr:MAG: hypothetical protein DRO97_01680 [Archaeoglobales archaeon]
MRDLGSLLLAAIGLYFGLFKEVWERKLKRNALMKILKLNDGIKEFYKDINQEFRPKRKYTLFAISLAMFLVFLLGYTVMGFKFEPFSLLIIIFFVGLLLFGLAVIIFSIILIFLPTKQVSIKIAYLISAVLYGIALTIFLSSASLYLLFKFDKSYVLLQTTVVVFIILVLVLFVMIPQKENDILNVVAKEKLNEFKEQFPKISVGLKNGSTIEGKLKNFLNSDFLETEVNENSIAIFWNVIDWVEV